MGTCSRRRRIRLVDGVCRPLSLLVPMALGNMRTSRSRRAGMQAQQTLTFNSMLDQ